MSDTILITYATRTGYTVGVAEAIANTLQAHGADVEVLPIQDVTDIGGYAAVVVGSGIQSSAWLPEAVDFVRTHQQVLQHKPFAAFFTCMTLAIKNKQAHAAINEFLAPVRKLVQPVSEGRFAGGLDLSKIEQPLARFGFRISVWTGVWKEGDHRDWDKIRAWANAIYPLLVGQPMGR